MKKTLSIFFILIYLVLLGQNTNDSLLQKIEKTHDLNQKTDLLLQLSENNKLSNVVLMRDYAKKALQLATQINTKPQTCKALILLGNADIIEGNYLPALKNFLKAQNTLESLDTNNSEIRQLLIKTYGSLGVVFSEQSNYTRAQEYYYKAVLLSEKENNSILSAKLYNNLGVVYKAQQNFDKAIQYFTKSVENQSIESQNIGITYTNIANCYQNQKNDKQALIYYQKASEALNKNPDFRAEGELYNNLGRYYFEKNNFQTALQNWQKAILAFDKIGDKFGKTDTYLYLSTYYLNIKNYKLALQNALMANQLATATQVLEQKNIAEKQLSDIYYKMNNVNQAYIHLSKYTILKDSLLQQNNVKNLLESQLNYEFEKQRMLYQEQLDKQKIMIDEVKNQNRLMLIFGIISALLIVGLLYLWANRRTIRRTLTLEKELAEYEQKALYLQMNPHFIFNSLGSISSFIVQNSRDSAVRYLAKFSKLMRLTLEYSKESLIAVDKEIESLQNYLELEQLRFNQKFDFEIEKTNDIEDDMAIPPLLIQPLVENAIIHGIAPAKYKGFLQIKFWADQQSIFCTITDNGIGYKTSLKNKENSVQVHQSLALEMIKNRLQKIQKSTGNIASLSIEENTNATGTKVNITLPVQFVKNKI